MNFIFISPNFPHTYWNFCDRLKRNGVNVLGIGDASYDGLEDGLKGALTEYFKVDSLEDYDQVFRAVAFFSYKYGKIDWIESLNEYWLEQDARLRTDFNVTTGIQSDRISFIKEKSLMKKLYREGGIPTARQCKVTTREAALEFIDRIGGYPVIVKPDIGVGANDTLYDNSPECFLPNMSPDHPYIDLYNQKQIIICVGQGAWEDDGIRSLRYLESVFREKGINAWCDFWGYDVNHDWPWWFKQMHYFLPIVLERWGY